MKARFYLLIALAAFLVAVTGSDLFARMTIAGASLSGAVAGHLEWLSLTAIGAVWLFIPFGLVALICAVVDQQLRRGAAVSIFAVALAALTYFYFSGFQDAQLALVEQRWTAATLSVGLLPLFAAAPVLLFIIIAVPVAAMIGNRNEASD